MKPMILEEYASLIFLRDLVERHSIRNERAMRLLLRHCCVHSASLLSIHKLYGDLASQGIGLSKDTLYEYVDALEQAGLLFTLPIYDRSLRKQSHNPKKMHVVDPVLTTAFSGTPDTDFGHRLESVVFLHERRMTDQLYYARQEHEVDLIVDAPSRKTAVHVAWDMNSPDTIGRELAAVRAGEKHFPGHKPLIVCRDSPAVPVPDGVQVMRAIDYLRQPTRAGT